MTNLFLTIGVHACACFTMFTALAAPTRFVEGELLVKFQGGPRGSVAEDARNTMKHEVKRNFDIIGWPQIKLPPGLTVEKALERYRNLPTVLAAEPNGLEPAIEPSPHGDRLSSTLATMTSPNDAMFSQQWGLTKIGATNAWNMSIGGTNVVVAVIDTGVNYNHEDLSENVWHNPGEIAGNGIDDDSNGHVDDVYGIDTADDAFGNDSDPMDVNTQDVGYHGTACAGIIGAVGNNARGISGVNWRVQIMAIRAVQQGNFISQADRIQAWEYVLLMKQRGANICVVSMSWGGTTFNAAARDACVAVGNAGIVQVAIAGNFSTDNDVVPFNPASYPASNMISVAASDESDNLASFSNYGRTNVDLAAPGVGIVSTSGASPNAYYGNPGLDGTSVAVPHVSGAAALLFAANPATSADDVKTALFETVDVLPAFTNKMVTDGRLNLVRAVNHPAVIPRGPPSVALQPRSQAMNESSNVIFNVIAYGAQPLAYQWHKQNLTLTNATNATLILTNLVGEDAGNYTVLVTNAYGAITSAVAVLTVVTRPRLVEPLTPLRISAVSGELVTLSVKTTGALPIGYRWRHVRTNGTSANLTNFVINEHACFFSFTAGANSAGAYTVILTNAAQVTSVLQNTNAILSVVADSDSDGLPDAWEAAHPNATDPAGDTDGDGLTNLQEYLAGTDPGNAASLLRIESIAKSSANTATLDFYAVSNRTYAIQARDAAGEGLWNSVADVIANHTNRLVEFEDVLNNQRYYRLMTPRP